MKTSLPVIILCFLLGGCAVSLDEDESAPAESEEVGTLTQNLQRAPTAPNAGSPMCFIDCVIEFNHCMKDAGGDKSLEWWCDYLLDYCIDSCRAPIRPLSIAQ